MFSLIIVVFILFLSVRLIPPPLYFLFLAPLGRQGQWRGAADKTSHVHSKNDHPYCHTPFPLMKTETTLAGAPCAARSLNGGHPSIYLSRGRLSSPRFSSFPLIELWHWCLPVWLSLSVTWHHLCLPGVANTGTSDWHTKPSIPVNASQECCSASEGSKP